MRYTIRLIFVYIFFLYCSVLIAISVKCGDEEAEPAKHRMVIRKLHPDDWWTIKHVAWYIAHEITQIML